MAMDGRRRGSDDAPPRTAAFSKSWPARPSRPHPGGQRRHTDGTVSTGQRRRRDGNVTNILPGYDPVSLVPAVIVLHGDGTVSAWGSDGLRPEDSGVQQIVAGYDPVARIPAVNVWHTDGTVSAWGSDGLRPSTAT